MQNSFSSKGGDFRTGGAFTDISRWIYHGIDLGKNQKKKKNQWGFCESITSYYIKLYRYQNSKGRERILLVSMNFKLSTNSVKMWESQFRYQEIYKQTLLSE